VVVETQSADGFAVRVRLRGSDREWLVAPGDTAEIRRDPSADIPLEHPNVSRGGHARLTRDDDGWVLAAAGDRGIFVNGVRTTRVRIGPRTVVRLGAADNGADLELALVPAPADPQIPRPPVADPASGAGNPDRSPTPPQRPAADGTPDGVAAGVSAGDTTAVVDDPDRLSYGPPLSVTAGDSTRILRGEAGHSYWVGRASDCDVVVDVPQVSRRHLLLAWTGDIWTVQDTSTRGTFDTTGSRLPETATPVTDAAVLRLGDPRTGEPVSLAVSGAPRRRTRGPVLLAGAAALATALVVVAASLLLPEGTTPPDSPDTLTSAELGVVKRSVVRLTMVGAEGPVGTGSGTIISDDGLILTNAHVADATAAGQAAQYGYFSSPPFQDRVRHLVVGITTRVDRPAQDRYRAKLLVSDGYLDLAVIQVYANADGSPLTGDLELPALPVADSRKVGIGDTVAALGFPGAAQSDSIAVTEGDVAAFVNDPHMHSKRAWFDTTALVRHGNSGGSAVNADGELIAVPTRLYETSQGDRSERLRPVEWATPLIEKAKAGGDLRYRSPFLVAPTGREQVHFNGATTTNINQCGPLDYSLPSGTETFAITFKVTRARPGLDLYPLLLTPAGDDVVAAGDPQQYRPGSCVVLIYDGDPLTDGTYPARLAVGPSAEGEYSFRTSLTIGDGATVPEGAVAIP
jgi:putative serine protease PepD